MHFDVVDEYLKFVNAAIKGAPETQLIASTHQEKLLDLNFISNESVLMFKIVDNKPVVEYLSEYKIRNDQILSKRFINDAFAVSPNISQITSILNNNLNEFEE